VPQSILRLTPIPLKFGETIYFITRSVSEETQERRFFLAYASGYEERMHAWQPNFNGIALNPEPEASGKGPNQFGVTRTIQSPAGLKQMLVQGSAVIASGTIFGGSSASGSIW
jgi:hypothetical protein